MPIFKQSCMKICNQLPHFSKCLKEDINCNLRDLGLLIFCFIFLFKIFFYISFCKCDVDTESTKPKIVPQVFATLSLGIILAELNLHLIT